MDKLKLSTEKWMSDLKSGLTKTRENFVSKVTKLFTFWKKIDDSFWEELEDIMLTSDIGIATSDKVISQMKALAKKEHILEPPLLMEELKKYLKEIMTPAESELITSESGTSVIVVIGVNGTGKTTTIAKLAKQFKDEGKSVLLAAADTFRAAAIDQLAVWANRLEIDLIKTKEGGDPSAVCFDAVSSAKAKKYDYLIIDTAGRLHSKVNLMEELKKMQRVIKKEIPSAPHETLIVLDATTGQNALIQAKTFSQVADITGIVLTKLDGTSKGGITIGITDELKIPVKFIGFGEKMEDLRRFNAEDFLNALFGES